MTAPHPLYLPETLTQELLLFDGLSRAGKGLVAPILSNLSRVEYAQINNPVDHIPILWKLGLIDTQSAAAFLRIAVDTKTYEQAIGRNTNTRLNDLSSIYNSLDAAQIIARTVNDEGQSAMHRYTEAKRISSFITHFSMPMIDLWLAAYPLLKVIVTVRHPIDVVHSSMKRNWGARWGEDPLGFFPTADINGKSVPWFAVPFAQDYLASSPDDRNAECILSLYDMYDETLAQLDNNRRKQIEVICFESFATDPMTDIHRIANWLDAEMPEEMPIILARERVPRKISIDARRQKFKDLQSLLDKTRFNRLIETSHRYEKRWNIEPIT